MVEIILYSAASFFIGLAADFAWAMWSISSNSGRAYVAANWGLLIFATNLSYVMLAIQGAWFYLAFFVAGSWLGTVFAVRKAAKSS